MSTVVKYIIGLIAAAGGVTAAFWIAKQVAGWASEKYLKPYIERLGEQGKKNAVTVAAVARTVCKIMLARFPDTEIDDLAVAIAEEIMARGGVNDIKVANSLAYEALLSEGKSLEISSRAAGLNAPATIKLRKLYPNGLSGTIIDESKTER